MTIISNKDYKTIETAISETTYNKAVMLVNTLSHSNNSMYFEKNKKYSYLYRNFRKQTGRNFKSELLKKSNVKYSHETDNFYNFKDENMNNIKISKDNIIAVIYK